MGRSMLRPYRECFKLLVGGVQTTPGMSLWCINQHQSYFAVRAKDNQKAKYGGLYFMGGEDGCGDGHGLLACFCIQGVLGPGREEGKRRGGRGPDLSTVLVSDGRWRSRNRAARYMRSLGDLATFESPMVPDFVTLGLAFNPKDVSLNPASAALKSLTNSWCLALNSC
jgi:hypothetical protein